MKHNGTLPYSFFKEQRRDTPSFHLYKRDERLQCCPSATCGFKYLPLNIHILDINCRDCIWTVASILFYHSDMLYLIFQILITSNDSRIRLYDLRDLNLSCKYKGYSNMSSQIRAGFRWVYFLSSLSVMFFVIPNTCYEGLQDPLLLCWESSFPSTSFWFWNTSENCSHDMVCLLPSALVRSDSLTTRTIVSSFKHAETQAKILPLLANCLLIASYIFTLFSHIEVAGPPEVRKEPSNFFYFWYSQKS